MVQTRQGTSNGPGGRDAALDYLMDMIGELALMARGAGEIGIAIHLEAIIAARRATPTDRPGGS